MKYASSLRPAPAAMQNAEPPNARRPQLIAAVRCMYLLGIPGSLCLDSCHSSLARREAAAEVA